MRAQVPALEWFLGSRQDVSMRRFTFAEFSGIALVVVLAVLYLAFQTSAPSDVKPLPGTNPRGPWTSAGWQKAETADGGR